MFEEATMTREETVKECKQLTAAIRKTESEKTKARLWEAHGEAASAVFTF